MFNIFKRTQKVSIPSNAIVAAVSGKIIPIEDVKDEVFAKKMLGDGVAIVPSDDVIVAPCQGKITMLYPTMHAFGIVNDDNLEVLIHIGINTVNLNGKGFKSYVKEGDYVNTGDKIIHVDSYSMKNDGYDLTTMILYPNCTYNLNIKKEGYAKKGKSVITTYEK